jgi:hypothetical protein
MIYLSLLSRRHQSGQAWQRSSVPALAPDPRSEDRNRKPTPSRHRFEKPIHNVKDLQDEPACLPLETSGTDVFIELDVASANRPLRRQSQQSCALWRASRRWPSLAACAN